MKYLIFLGMLTACSVDVNLKQKTPIIIQTDSEGTVSGKVEIVMGVDVATQVKELCGDPGGQSFAECSLKVINIYENLTELVKLLDKEKGNQ